MEYTGNVITKSRRSVLEAVVVSLSGVLPRCVLTMRAVVVMLILRRIYKYYRMAGPATYRGHFLIDTEVDLE